MYNQFYTDGVQQAVIENSLKNYYVHCNRRLHKMKK